MKGILLSVFVVLLLLCGSGLCTANAWADEAVVATPQATTPSATVQRDVIPEQFPPASFAFFFQADHPRPWYVSLMLSILLVIVAIIILYTIRHYWFTLNRLFGRQRHPYLDIDVANWPTVTVAVPAHNEELVIRHIMSALLEVDYPADRLLIMPINDRSTDNTGAILDELAQQHPHRIQVVHRNEGVGGKAAALKEATTLVESEILLVFDADYLPGKGLIKQLVAPFFDPEIGATMGRVVPLNVGKNLLTRFLDLERSGGYQVDQQARMNLHLVPQYGGTVGGVRMSALETVGGWDEVTLAEDTEMTYRMLMAGWKTAYQNRSECYEEIPETWFSRMRQLKRWARGHNHVTHLYTLALLKSRRVSLGEKIDGLLLLGVYAMSLVIVVGWALAITLFFLGEQMTYGVIAILVVTSYGTLGNFAAFFEIAAAMRLDGRRQSISLLSINILNFLVSLAATTRATFTHLLPPEVRKKHSWEKTERFRRHKADAP
jgi:cellulose synthase/poly-beta-1,6-N-acetylglucosamine synthase-like glycosyltransferase